jgi:hypothetical protein
MDEQVQTDNIGPKKYFIKCFIIALIIGIIITICIIIIMLIFVIDKTNLINITNY